MILRGEPEAARASLGRITAIGTALPTTSYSQKDVIDFFGIADRRIAALFHNSAIERRHLTLPGRGPDGTPAVETQGELLDKHVTTGVDLGVRAIDRCLEGSGAIRSDIGYLCCVSSTGFLTPGFSALLIKEMDLPRDCGRLDVVGMGCNAGLNALAAVSGWAATHPGQLAVMACIEVCSAAYVLDGTMRTAVVNSLFGDGAAAIGVVAGAAAGTTGPALRGFASCIVPDAIDAMRFDWDDHEGRFRFSLDRDIPYVVGANAGATLDRLLDAHGVGRAEIAHWLVHSGGKKVIDAVRVNLGLTRHDVRHTTGVLRDYGNLSSGAFLFSYERLCAEAVTRPGDLGVLMTMGPGSTIEMAMVEW